MASNSSTITDEDDEYSDWIELHNLSEDDMDIGGCYLSDDPDNLIQWIFPNHIIPANGFLLVFASGKDRRTKELHSNFKISSSGEQLYLVSSDGKTIISSIIDFPPQETDVSYSQINQSWLFTEPTPGSFNSVGSYLNPPSFSVDHGFYDEPFMLTMSNPTGDSILYAMDGSEPGLEHGIKFLSPIQIDSTCIIRAVAFTGTQVSKASTITYIFPEKVKSQPDNPEGYPINWGPFSTLEGLAPADYEMDPEICHDPAYDDQIVPALKSIPSISIVTDKNNLFSNSTDPVLGGIYIHTDPPTGGLGEDWERPVSVEYILPDGNSGFQVDCGLRIHGGHSRVPEKNPKHSFRLVFRNEYGPKTLNYSIFDDGATRVFNTLVLRAGFNQTWIHWDTNRRNSAQYIQDSWTKDAWRQMGHAAAHNKFVHLYINGMYWGLYNISERIDDEFMAEYLGGEMKDFDIIKDYGEVAAGEKAIWNEMMDIARAGLSDAISYYKLQGKNEFGCEDESLEVYLDIPNLIDFMVLNFYAGNLDWDHHNWVAARNQINPGRGFQFFPWDSERIFYKLNNNVVDENNEDRPSFLYNQLRQNPAFRIDFANRANELLGPGGILSPDSVKVSWTKRSKEVELAVVAESARWGDYRRDKHQHKNGPFELYTKFDHWDKQLQWLMNDYFPKRSQIVLEQLKEIGLAGDIITEAESISTVQGKILRVYPVPFTTQVNIDFGITYPGNVEIVIYSPEGKVAYYSKEEHKNPGQKQFAWQPENEINGIYFYQIRTRDIIYSGKLIYIK